MKPVLYIYDDIFLKHETGSHLENKNRLLAINQAIKDSGLIGSIKREKPIKATLADICRIHTERYVEHVSDVIQSGYTFLDSMDTVVSSHSLEAAYYAAGAGILAADRIMAGEHEVAFCAVRPPGHHAEKEQSMGFCLFNNIAITARYLQEKHNLEKIFILDWDVHHGNGTEHSFYQDDTVFFLSLHQYPHYPGTGRAEDMGTGKGKNYTKNYPMVPGSGDKDYLLRFEEIVSIIKNYRPDFILISCGFDAHIRDPLSSINLSSEIFGKFTEMIKNSSDSAHGRIISFLEGGYDLKALGESAVCHLQALQK